MSEYRTGDRVRAVNAGGGFDGLVGSVCSVKIADGAVVGYYVELDTKPLASSDPGWPFQPNELEPEEPEEPEELGEPVWDVDAPMRVDSDGNVVPVTQADYDELMMLLRRRCTDVDWFVDDLKDQGRTAVFASTEGGRHVMETSRLIRDRQAKQ